MKLEISQADLSNRLVLIEKATSRSSVSATTKMVLLGAEQRKEDDDLIRLSSTDGQVSVDTTATCKVHKPGQVLISAQRLVAACNVMPRGSTILLEEKNAKLRVSVGSRKHEIKTVDLAMKPVVREPETTKGIRIKTAHLKDAMARLGAAISHVPKEHVDRVGLHFDIDEGTLTAVVLSNVYFSRLTFKDAFAKKDHFQVLIPMHSMSIVEKMCEEGDEEIALDKDEHMLWISTKRTMTASVRPGDAYPPWRTMFSSLEPFPVGRIGRLAFQDAITAVMAGITSSDQDGVLMVFDPEQKQLELSLAAGGKDDGTDNNDVVPMTINERFEYRVDPRYLNEIVRSASYDITVQRVVGPSNTAIGFVTDDGYQAVLIGMTGGKAAT